MSHIRISLAALLVLFLANTATGEGPLRASQDMVAPISASVQRHARALAVQRAEQPNPDNCRRRRILKGLAIGAAAGAVVGVVGANVLRDCGTCETTYVRSGVIFGSIGGGIGAAIGALVARGCP